MESDSDSAKSLSFSKGEDSSGEKNDKADDDEDVNDTCRIRMSKTNRKNSVFYDADSYEYRQREIMKTGQLLGKKRICLRCTTPKCTGKAVIEPDLTVTRTSEHHHRPPLGKKEARDLISESKAKRAKGLSTQNILEEFLNDQPDHVLAYLPTKRGLRRRIQMAGEEREERTESPQSPTPQPQPEASDGWKSNLVQQLRLLSTRAAQMENENNDRVVVLNVGGQFFQTRMSTLTRRGENELSKIATGDVRIQEDGTYFIDRDPTVFRYILNYLRDGRIIFPDDPIIVAQLFVESKELGLSALSNRLSLSSKNASGYHDFKF